MARSKPLALGAAALALGALLVGLRADAARPDLMSVDEVRPGMKGHAVTVFSGSGTDRFEIEVIDVVRDYLPRQDAILFRSSDPRMVHSGIVGGMSGSPIYIDGRLVGALAYGYRFNKDPIGGITPISNMLAVGDLPFRPDVLPQNKPRGRVRPGAAGWADAMLGIGTSPLPPRRRPDELTPQGGLTPLGAPMSVSGLGSAATRFLADELGLVPARGGSGGASEGAAPPPKSWQPGDSVSVVLIRGDNSVAPNGTVTWVGGKQGERLLAFGHEMFGAGPSNLPIADARVHVIIPSVERSVKISSPLHLRGAMIQDRQPAISLRTDQSAPMIPVVTELRAAEPDMAPRVYRSEVALSVDLTPALAAGLLVDALSEGAGDGTEVVAEVVHEIAVTTRKGPRSLTIRHEEFFPGGVDLRALSRGRGTIVLAALLNNDFEVAQIRSIKQSVSLRYDAPVDTLESIRILDDEVRAGDLVHLELKIRSYKGDLRAETLALRVPDDAAGQDIQIEVTGGDGVRPPRPMPASLDDLIDTLEATYPTRSLVATIYREAEGLSTRHGLLPDLPASVLETLAQRGSTSPAVRFKQMARRVIPGAALIEGEHSIKVSVEARRSFEPSSD